MKNYFKYLKYNKMKIYAFCCYIITAILYTIIFLYDNTNCICWLPFIHISVPNTLFLIGTSFYLGKKFKDKLNEECINAIFKNKFRFLDIITILYVLEKIGMDENYINDIIRTLHIEFKNASLKEIRPFTYESVIKIDELFEKLENNEISIEEAYNDYIYKYLNLFSNQNTNPLLNTFNATQQEIFPKNVLNYMNGKFPKTTNLDIYKILNIDKNKLKEIEKYLKDNNIEF